MKAWQIAAAVGTTILFFSVLLPVMSDPLTSLSLLDLILLKTGIRKTFTGYFEIPTEFYGIYMTMILFPIAMILGALGTWKRVLALTAGSVGLLCWATALVVVTNYKYSNNLRVQILQYGTGIFFGIIGSVILVIAYFLPRAQHEPYNQPPKIQPLSSPTPDETSREVSTEDKKVGRKRSPIRWIVGIAVVAAIVSVLFVPLVPVEATFNVSEPYSRLATYEVTAASLTGHWDLTRGTYHTSEVAVRNTDVKGGTFVVTHYVYDTNGLFGTKTTNGYVGSGSTVTFAADFDTQFLASYRAEYSVIAPSISGENMVSRKGTAYKSIIDLWLHI